MASAQELSMTPAWLPPPGAQSNLIDSVDQGYIYVIVGSIGLAFVAVFVSLRMYAKTMVLKAFGWDDAACIIAFIGRIAVTSLVFHQSLNGVGKHIWDISVTQLLVINKDQYSQLATKLDPPTYFFTKVSLLLLYFRLFSPDRLFKYLILAGITFCFVAYTAGLICYIYIAPILELKVNDAIGAFNVFSDIYILCLPIMAVSKLRLPRGKKIGVMVIFLSGILACIMSILTLIYRATFKDGPGSDLTWQLLPANTVSTVEGDIGIMCACMPFFPALVKSSPALQHFFTSIRSLRSRVLGTKVLDDSRPSTQNSRRHNVKRARAEEDYMELGEAKLLTALPQIHGPNTYRMEFEGFRNDSR